MRIIIELSNVINITNIYFIAYDLQCIHCRMQYMHVAINVEFKIYNVTITCIILSVFLASPNLNIFLLNFVDITMIGLTLFVMGVFEVYRWLNKEGNKRIHQYCCNHYWNTFNCFHSGRGCISKSLVTNKSNTIEINGERYFNCCYNLVLVWALN